METISIAEECSFCPAPGYRTNSAGVLDGGGSSGYNWSFAASGTDSIHLNFGATWLYFSLASKRGYGFQLRCLSE